jgi:flagellar basal body P-ring protein FlgI
VTINERTGVVVSTGTVRISRVTISVNGIVLEIKENGTLDAVQGQVRRLQYSSAEIIAIVKELHRAGALQAELITE